MKNDQFFWEGAKSDRVFEVLITDKSAKRTFAIDVKFKPGELLDDPGKVTQKLELGFGALLKALFRGGRLPELSTKVVDPSELPQIEGASKY